MVSISASICVGCASSVSPFQTGTSEYSASSSTVFCANPLYSMPSNIDESTRAVSAMLSFLPICEPCGSRYVTPIPRSCAATSKLHRVRVLVFSKISAMFLPLQYLCGTPSFFSVFNFSARSIRYVISSPEKSSSFKKSLPFKFILFPPRKLFSVYQWIFPAIQTECSMRATGVPCLLPSKRERLFSYIR